MSKRNRHAYRDSLDIHKAKIGSGSHPIADMEAVLRGFQKVPIVLCERYDIRPYLKMQPDLRKPTFVATDQVASFSKLCSVKLARENLELLQDLTRSRLDNTNLSCNICQKVYTSERKLLNHQENKHVICYKPENKIRKKVSFSDEIIVHELKEYHRCRKCPKIYEDYESLKAHMKDFHKKRKCYICFYCSKDFVDRMFFKVHIKLHCDACGLLLPNKKQYNDHRRNTCKTIKKYTCKTCNIILFHFLDMKDHSYEHLGKFYICDICKDRFDDKCALSHHIKFLHSKRRPKSLYTSQVGNNETIYSCNFCDLTSLDQGLMDKHVSTFPEYEKCAMTGYKDFYFCDQCFEKFSTETDMLQHKWSHYLKNHPEISADSPTPITVFNMEGIHNKNVIESSTGISQNTLKRFYNINEELPATFQPRVVVERLTWLDKNVASSVNLNDVTNLSLDVDTKGDKPKKRRTLISNHQCLLCFKFLSTSYTLKRHMITVHDLKNEDGTAYDNLLPKYQDHGNLRCNVCEEDFALPSLLQTHRCYRSNTILTQMLQTDAKSNLTNEYNMGFDDIISIDDDDDYMNNIDFDIPAPIVELTEFDNVTLVIGNDRSDDGAVDKHNMAVDGFNDLNGTVDGLNRHFNGLNAVDDSNNDRLNGQFNVNPNSFAVNNYRQLGNVVRPSHGQLNSENSRQGSFAVNNRPSFNVMNANANRHLGNIAVFTASHGQLSNIAVRPSQGQSNSENSQLGNIPVNRASFNVQLNANANSQFGIIAVTENNGQLGNIAVRPSQGQSNSENSLLGNIPVNRASFNVQLTANANRQLGNIAVTENTQLSNIAARPLQEQSNSEKSQLGNFPANNRPSFNVKLNASANRQLSNAVGINRQSIDRPSNPRTYIRMPVNKVVASNSEKEYFSRLINTVGVDGKQSQSGNLRLVVTEVPIEF